MGRFSTLLERLTARFARSSAGTAPADAHPASISVTFYHDVEQDLDSQVDAACCRAAVDRWLEIEARRMIHVTYNVAGVLLEREPEMIERIERGGHEIAFHSYTHDPGWSPGRYAGEVRACRAAGAAVKGYRSPRSQWDASTLEALWTNGFLWNAESDHSPAPYFIHQGLVRLPIGADDWSVFTGHSTLEQWVSRFGQLTAARRYFGWGTHDFVTASDPDQSLEAYERVIGEAIDRGARIVTFGQAADEFRSRALADHYTSTAVAWNRGTQRLYRTRRFQELLRREVRSMTAPVVVDLGSGGGVLSAPLADIAERIYCVDNAPGMLSSLPHTPVIQGVLGDTADSRVEAATADLVICARVLEYLYDPDRAAGEIRRIAKQGATVFATFPADRGQGRRQHSTAPDRIRRYFTRQQVMAWGERIGGGRIFGVQYDDREPATEAEEREYRRLEEEDPADRLPANWVFVGRTSS